MNPFSILSIAAAALSLVLSVWLFVSSISNQGLQSQLQDQQQELLNQQQEIGTQQQKLQVQQQQIQVGRNLAEQVGPAILKDLATVAVQKKDEKIKGLLARHGYSLQETPAKGTPAATPTPATSVSPRP